VHSLITGLFKATQYHQVKVDYYAYKETQVKLYINYKRVT